jgi:hypothetical protein
VLLAPVLRLRRLIGGDARGGGCDCCWLLAAGCWLLVRPLAQILAGLELVPNIQYIKIKIKIKYHLLHHILHY